MGRKRAQRKPSLEVGERYSLVRIGDTYFIKGHDGVLERAEVTPISDEEARRLMREAGIEGDQR
jgi:hypothetical protein